VIVDIGTGDGRYVYRSARANPDRFYIGLDVQRKALEKVSEKVHRKPGKGGLSNVLFLQASVEELPEELNNVADEIHVHFPWGSLLRAVAVGDEQVMTGLRRIAAPGSWLEVVIGIDEYRDAGEAERLELPSLSEEYVRAVLKPRYAMAGFNIEEFGITSPAQWPEIDTTWAKRLSGGSRRRLLFIVARAGG
jgi:16S rRNA (adenine(1408)-N(1))-methyltransferase